MQARPGPLPLLSLAFLAAWASIEPLSTRPRKPQGVVPPAPGRLPAGKKLYVRNLTYRVNDSELKQLVLRWI